MNSVAESKLKILVVEDHPIMRVGIGALLEKNLQLESVVYAGSGEEAILLHTEHRPDVTLMDLRLPGISGVETIKRIRLCNPSARFIVLTTYEGDEDIHQALQAGASGYLIKGMPHATLSKAIERVHAGGRFLPSAVRHSLENRMPGDSLSERELDVLLRVAQGKSNKEIATELGIAEITVKMRMSTILSRLNVNDRTQAVVIALQRGLLHL